MSKVLCYNDNPNVINETLWTIITRNKRQICTRKKDPCTKNWHGNQFKKRKKQNNRAPKLGGIKPDFLKCGNKLNKFLTKLFQRKELAEKNNNWSKWVHINLKTGNKYDTNNYKSISVIPSTTRIFLIK